MLLIANGDDHLKRGPKPNNPVARFWPKVDCSGGADACWPWTGGKHEYGYGMFNDGEHIVTASSFALGLVKNKPVGGFACHTCDFPPCCNQLHLFWGTQADNMADAASKDRLNPVRGSAHPRSKLSANAVLSIRRRLRDGLATIASLAKEYAVSAPSIHQVAIGKTWRHTLGEV